MRIPTNTPLDKLLNGGIETDAITNVYGPAGCGKTNVALCTTLDRLRSGESVAYVDTEGSFSLERFEQLGGNERLLKKLLFIEVHDWKEQHEKVQALERLVAREKVALIVIDSMVALYRLELGQEFATANRQLATQYSVLSRIARTKKIPALVTNQVYSLGDATIELTSRTVAKYWSKALIELRKLEQPGHRIAIVRKHRSIPEGKSVEFEITAAKLREVKGLW